MGPYRYHLRAHLPGVAVQQAIGASYSCDCEDAGGQSAPDAPDAVHREHVQRVVQLGLVRMITAK